MEVPLGTLLVWFSSFALWTWHLRLDWLGFLVTRLDLPFSYMRTFGGVAIIFFLIFLFSYLKITPCYFSCLLVGEFFI